MGEAFAFFHWVLHFDYPAYPTASRHNYGWSCPGCRAEWFMLQEYHRPVRIP